MEKKQVLSRIDSQHLIMRINKDAVDLTFGRVAFAFSNEELERLYKTVVRVCHEIESDPQSTTPCFSRLGNFQCYRDKSNTLHISMFNMVYALCPSKFIKFVRLIESAVDKLKIEKGERYSFGTIQYSEDIEAILSEIQEKVFGSSK